MTATTPTRRVVLLETDERAGLVAELAVVCNAEGISLEITTGPAHVLLTFAADEATVDGCAPAWKPSPEWSEFTSTKCCPVAGLPPVPLYSQ